MKGHLTKGQVGAARDALADLNITAEVRHVEGGRGFAVDTSRLSGAERQRIEARFRELGLGTPGKDADAE